MSVNAILAHDSKYGIGRDGDLPWPKNDTDMKWFRDCTNGHVILMGRKTWQSIGSKKLPNRKNIVVTTSDIDGNPDAIVSGDISQIISSVKKQYPHLKLWVIGGAEIYNQSLPLCDNIYVTKFSGDYQCDTFVDLHEIKDRNFLEVAKKQHDGLTFSIWSRF